MAKNLTQGDIGPLLYRLTSPMVLGILAIFLFNVVDTYFISLLGTQPLAAVSFTFPVTMMVMNIAIGLSIATGAVVARALGQQDKAQAQYWVSNSLYLSLIISVVLVIVGYLVEERLFKLLGADDELIPLILTYMQWWLIGSVFLIIMIVINACIRATGNTRFPSFIMLMSAVINGILDPLLIFGIGPFPHLGMEGAAIATMIAWFLAFVMIIYKVIQMQLITLGIPEQCLTAWRKLSALAIPAALTNMLGPISNGILVALVAQYGTDAVAAYGVGSRLEPLAVIVIMAFTASLPPFVGQNHGAGQHERIFSALNTSMQFIMAWQLAIYGLMALLAGPISQLFSSTPEVQNIIKTFIYIVPISYMGLGLSLVCTATINALHKPRISLMINLLRLFGVYLPFAWLGNHFAGLTGLFWGCAFGNLMMGIIIMMLFKKVRTNPAWSQKLLAV